MFETFGISTSRQTLERELRAMNNRSRQPVRAITHKRQAQGRPYKTSPAAVAAVCGVLGE